MFYRLRKELNYAFFNALTSGIDGIPAIVTAPGRLKIVSRVSHSDIRIYLLAIHSLHRYLREGEVIVIDDGSLNARDEYLLSKHVHGLQVLREKAISTGVCPGGGSCWERLTSILDLCQSSYVIQMDSDTLTTGPIGEVADCLEANRSFVLPGEPSSKFMTLEEASAFADRLPGNHIQAVAERSLRETADAASRRYVRGCAGFCGFARGSADRGKAERFSVEMSRLVTGAKWSEWGSEQVTSNYLIANSEAPVLLPYPRYAGFAPGLDPSGSVFLHFYGTHRFRGGHYAKLARRAIREMGGRA